TFASVYKKQKELYEDGEKQMMQVMAIHEYIYQQLYNVNSLFKQGKQMKYIYEYAKQIPENGAEMLRLSAENPQHSVWLKDYYQTLFEQMVGLMTQIEEVLLKSDKDLLMDAADRNELISKIYYKLRQINVSILSVTNLIQFGKNRAYIYSIPILGNYVSQDKMLVESIFDKYKRLQTKY
ncbi:MAG: hypothetical protein Q4G08_09745, partial [Capnocytophaga sp.]|nr:hypothetical protein [Capnocytophaga sp.]